MAFRFRTRKMVVAAGIVAAVAIAFAFLNIELPYRVFHSPRSGHRLEVRYKVYSVFTEGYAQGRPGVVYLKDAANSTLHKAAIGSVGDLSGPEIEWHDDHVRIRFDKWFYAGKNSGHRMGFEQ